MLSPSLSLSLPNVSDSISWIRSHTQEQVQPYDMMSVCVCVCVCVCCVADELVRENF